MNFGLYIALTKPVIVRLRALSELSDVTYARQGSMGDEFFYSASVATYLNWSQCQAFPGNQALLAI